MQEIEFGFLPESFNVIVGDIQISDLPTLAAEVRSVNADGMIKGDWYHAPPAESVDMFSDKLTTHPHRSRVFSLPKTHHVRHAAATDPAHLAFIVWVLSFVKGIRLTTTEAGFLDATPINTHILTDAVFTREGERRALEIANDYWQQHEKDRRVAKAVTGIVHCLFLAKMTLSLDFESFIYLYTAFDGCFAVVRKLHPAIASSSTGHLPHGHRIAAMCDHFKMPTPAWADRTNGTVVKPRNDALHEGLFFGEPFGFSVYGGNSTKDHGTLLEMEALLCRLLCVIIGLNDRSYIDSPVNTRQQHLVQLI